MKRGFFKRRILVPVAAILVALGVAMTMPVTAQQSTGLFKANPQKRDEPIKITSATLEVRDKQKVATFSGDVQVVQGDTELRSAVLVVFYESDQADKKQGKASPPPAAGERGNQKISRMEARGSVVVTQKDQRAVGDHADFDVPKNVMVLSGNVVVTRGDDVLRGNRLHVNMTTGIYTMEASGGRVEMLVKSKSEQSPSLTPARPKRSN